jgi:hypothetical protein
LTIGVTAVAENASWRSAASVFAELGPWEGETTEEVLPILVAEGPAAVVTIRAVGAKIRARVLIGGEEVDLT